MINYGIVGIGGFATRWVEALRDLELQGVARLQAAVVRSPEKYARQVSELVDHGTVICPTLDAMLTAMCPDIDIVGIPTGIADHCPMAEQAMRAGYNVLVEKPVAATIQEVLRLRDAERESGRWCAVGYQLVYSATTQWLRDKVLRGELGCIREARSMIGWPRSRGYYARNRWAGQLADCGRWVLDGPATNATAHYLTNMLYLVGAQQERKIRLSSVRGELYRAKSIPSYNTSCIEVYMDDTRILHVASHSLERTLSPTIDLLCERATVHWKAENDSATIVYENGREETYHNPHASKPQLDSLAQVANVAAGRESRPLCGLEEAGPHVLAINLAFESSRGIFDIPERFVYEVGEGDARVVCVEGMSETLQHSMRSGAMFSDQMAPWARCTEPVFADGYVRFPQSQGLAGKLAVLP